MASNSAKPCLRFKEVSMAKTQQRLIILLIGCVLWSIVEHQLTMWPVATPTFYYQPKKNATNEEREKQWIEYHSVDRADRGHRLRERIALILGGCVAICIVATRAFHRYSPK